MLCPCCGKPCEADFVDIGVGEARISPFRCEPCGWVETYPPMDPTVDLLDD